MARPNRKSDLPFGWLLDGGLFRKLNTLTWDDLFRIFNRWDKSESSLFLLMNAFNLKTNLLLQSIWLSAISFNQKTLAWLLSLLYLLAFYVAFAYARTRDATPARRIVINLKHFARFIHILWILRASSQQAAKERVGASKVHQLSILRAERRKRRYFIWPLRHGRRQKCNAIGIYANSEINTHIRMSSVCQSVRQWVCMF